MSLWHCREHGVYGPEGVCPTCGKQGSYYSCLDAEPHQPPSAITTPTDVGSDAEGAARAKAVSDGETSRADGGSCGSEPRLAPRCLVTGNLCGTDTWMDGGPCRCAECQAWIGSQEPAGRVAKPASSCGLPADSYASTAAANYVAAMRLEHRAELAYTGWRQSLVDAGLGRAREIPEWQAADSYEREAWRVGIHKLDEEGAT